MTDSFGKRLTVELRGTSRPKVVCAGRKWNLMWEDGQSGIYRLENATTMKVEKQHELANSDDPPLVANLLDKVADSACNAVLDARFMSVSNKPLLPSASVLGGIMNELDNSADVADSDMGQTKAAPGGMHLARIVTPQLPQHRPTPAGSDEVRTDAAAASETKDHADMLDVLAGFKVPTPCTSSVRPKAKAKGKAQKTSDLAGEPPAKKQRLVESLEPPTLKKQNGVSVADAVMEADSKWLEETKAEMRKAMRLDIADDSEYRLAMNKCAELGKLLKSIKYRKRMLKRRAGNADEPCEALQCLWRRKSILCMTSPERCTSPRRVEMTWWLGSRACRSAQKPSSALPFSSGLSKPCGKMISACSDGLA